MANPIRPEDIVDSKVKYLPDAVIDVFNRLIAVHYSNGSANIKQNIIVAALIEALGIERQAIFDNHYLDVEDVYRASGWNVEYDKPAYNESYEAFFTFKKAGK